MSTSTANPTPVKPASEPPLKALLLGFRREVTWVAIFGVFSNLLMLTPTLYMMQVYDRALADREVERLPNFRRP